MSLSIAHGLEILFVAHTLAPHPHISLYCLQRIADYPNLENYTREIYQMSGVKESVNMKHIKVCAHSVAVVQWVNIIRGARAPLDFMTHVTNGSRQPLAWPRYQRCIPSVIYVINISSTITTVRTQ